MKNIKNYGKIKNQKIRYIEKINLFEFSLSSFGIHPILLIYLYYNNLSQIFIRHFIPNNIK